MSQVARRGSPTRPAATARASPAWPGVPPELRAEHVDHPGRLGGGQDASASSVSAANGFSHRTWRPAATASRASGGVGVGRRGDGHGVDPRRAERVVERRQGRGAPRRGGARSRRLGCVATDDRQDVEAGGAEGADVGVAAEAGSDDDDPASLAPPPGWSASPTTCQTSRRVASAAVWAASVAPSAWRSSENTSTPMGATAPTSGVHGGSRRGRNRPSPGRQAVVQRGLDEVLLGLRRAVVDLDGQHPLARNGAQVARPVSRSRAQCHVSTLRPPLARSASARPPAPCPGRGSVDHASHSKWTSRPCSAARSHSAAKDAAASSTPQSRPRRPRH